MSKTIDLQVEKSQMLIDGMKKNLNDLTDKGVNSQQLDTMQAALEELKAANAECDALRSELSKKVKRLNEHLAVVKEQFAEKKKLIKGYWPQEQWMRYGVADKR